VWSLHYRLSSNRWFGGAMPLTTRARNVLAVLESELESNVPIVFVCHSYGGLLVKQILRTGEEMGTEYEALIGRVAGIVFLATPNTGASIATFVDAIGPLVGASSAIKELRRSSAVLQDLNFWFRERAGQQRWLLRSYFETLPTFGTIVVDESSADLGVGRPIPVDANHLQICKPAKPDFRVKHTLAMIEQIVTSSSVPASVPGPTPLSQILAATDEQLPYFKAKFKAELASDPQNIGLRTALVHLDLLAERSHRAGNVQSTQRGAAGFRFAQAFVVVFFAAGIAALASFAYSNWIGNLETVASRDVLEKPNPVSKKQEFANDVTGNPKLPFGLENWEQMKSLPPPSNALQNSVVVDNAAGISFPVRQPNQKGPRKDVADVVKKPDDPAPPTKMAMATTTQSARLSQATTNVEEESVVKPQGATGALPTFRWPVRGKVISTYGASVNGKTNDGIDLAVPEGTPIKASEDGVVAYAGNELKGYGNLVLIRHSNGYVTAYAHASELLVKRGDTIKRGQIIAKSGQSGEVAIPQLHFEIRKGSSPVDPLQFLNGA
jgi:Peptidase family M23